MTLTELFQAFDLHLTLKHRSGATLRYYANTRASLERHFAESPGDEAPLAEHVTVHQLRQFVAGLEVSGLGSGGIHAHVRAVRALFNWAVKEEMLEKSPAKRLELPALPQKRQPAVTALGVKKLLEAARATDQPLRDRALLLTLFDTGVRVSEFVGLCFEDVLFEQGLLRVQGKGNKERFVPVGARAMDEIARYRRKERDPKHAGVRHVFLSRAGSLMTRSGISIRLALLARAVGIGREQVAPHAFRRGFAVEFLRNGGDVFTLQQILGHTSLEMTRRYVTFLDEDLKSAHLRFSPVDWM